MTALRRKREKGQRTSACSHRRRRARTWFPPLEQWGACTCMGTHIHKFPSVCSLWDILEQNKAVSLCVCSLKIEIHTHTHNVTLSSAEIERMGINCPSPAFKTCYSFFFLSDFLFPLGDKRKREDRLNNSKFPVATLPHGRIPNSNMLSTALT